MKISVALCTYNGEAYLKEQLESIAAQSRLPDELIISDDLSVDNSAKVIEQFASSSLFPVRVSINQSRLGSIKNFEKAIGLCRGEVVALCDQDDVWDADKLEMLEGAFLSTPQVGLVFSNAELVDANLKRHAESLFERLGFNDRKQRLVKAGKALDVLLKETLVCGATMAFRSEYKELVLPIPAEGPLIHDGWIVLLISAIARIDFISRPLMKYRQHSAQQMGAPPAPPLRDSVARAVKVDPKFYLRQAQQLAEALECLLAYGLDARQEKSLREKILHLHERAAMPSQHLKRLRSVSREIGNLHYHRFSNGWFSAAKDLLA